MKTPCTTFLNSPGFADVYSPSEDTFLLLDALELDAMFIKRTTPTITLEIGSGSGIVSAFLGNLCSDPHFHACLASSYVIRQNYPKLTFDAVHCNLSSPLSHRLRGSVDVLLFNPPYVPTSTEEFTESRGTIAATWSGGVKGRQVIDAFLEQCIDLLSPSGALYMLLLDENRPNEVHKRVKDLSNGFLLHKLILHRRVKNESLGVYRYYRSPHPISIKHSSSY